LFANQVRPAQASEVFRHRWPRHREYSGDLSGGPAATSEEIEHRPARRVGERREHDILSTCNRWVSHDV
jgi:hypothetical protein